MRSRLAVAASLSLVIAACGSPAEESDEPEAAATTSPAAVPAADTSAPDTSASETPETEASAAPSPPPTATASAKPAPTPVAAAGPPEAFKQCAACHSTEPGKTLIGPSLAGVYGTKAGEIPGFKFSDAMKSSGLTWNQPTLDRYLADPKGVVPGTTMSFGGVKDDAKRAAIIAYLKTL